MYDGSMIDWLPYSRVSDYIGSCERLVGLVDSEQVTVKMCKQTVCVGLAFELSICFRNFILMT